MALQDTRRKIAQSLAYSNERERQFLRVMGGPLGRITYSIEEDVHNSFTPGNAGNPVSFCDEIAIQPHGNVPVEHRPKRDGVCLFTSARVSCS